MTPSSARSALSRPEDHVIVIFGATGDLARRKLLPGLFHLFAAGLLPSRWRIVGVSQDDLEDDDFRAAARRAVDEFGHADADDCGWEDFQHWLTYVPAGDGERVSAAVRTAEEAVGRRCRRLYYLSVPPAAFGDIVRSLGAARLTDRARVVLEKPFGHDLASARELNRALHDIFDEDQTFRIDHFLGKEPVQNLLALRFANGLFEPIWNRDHIASVQIDVPETLSVGTRAAFYEATGAFRDMVVTHLFQVLSFVAMEPPTSLAAKALVDEKVKVFESMQPLHPQDVVRGQYEGYRQESGVDPDSPVETFVAARAWIDNWRWAGVPFYLRTGKRMAEQRRMVTITLKRPPRQIFSCSECADHPFDANELVFDLGDAGAVTANFLAKVPGARMELERAELTFRYGDSVGTHALEAYERLLHDVMLGDHTLFTRADGIERLWEVAAPVLERADQAHPYAPGSWGPEAADALIAPGRWALPRPG